MKRKFYYFMLSTSIMFGVGFNSAENTRFEVSPDFNFYGILQSTLAGTVVGTTFGAAVGSIAGTFVFPGLGTVGGAAFGAAALGLFTAGVGFAHGANNAAEGGLDGSGPRRI